MGMWRSINGQERMRGRTETGIVSRLVTSGLVLGRVLIVGTATYFDSSECIAHGACDQRSEGVPHQGV